MIGKGKAISKASLPEQPFSDCKTISDAHRKAEVQRALSSLGFKALGIADAVLDVYAKLQKGRSRKWALRKHPEIDWDAVFKAAPVLENLFKAGEAEAHGIGEEKILVDKPEMWKRAYDPEDWTPKEKKEVDVKHKGYVTVSGEDWTEEV